MLKNTSLAFRTAASTDALGRPGPCGGRGQAWTRGTARGREESTDLNRGSAPGPPMSEARASGTPLQGLPAGSEGSTHSDSPCPPVPGKPSVTPSYPSILEPTRLPATLGVDRTYSGRERRKAQCPGNAEEPAAPNTTPRSPNTPPKAHACFFQKTS